MTDVRKSLKNIKMIHIAYNSLIPKEAVAFATASFMYIPFKFILYFLSLFPQRLLLQQV